MKITLLQYLRTENTPFSKIKTYIFWKGKELYFSFLKYYKNYDIYHVCFI
jgi:hypothetical protein